jgi:hypothetical protein
MIKEYTIVPDFGKRGYKILAITFVKLNKALSQEQIEKARRIAKESLNAELLKLSCSKEAWVWILMECSSCTMKTIHHT